MRRSRQCAFADFGYSSSFPHPSAGTSKGRSFILYDLPVIFISVQ